MPNILHETKIKNYIEKGYSAYGFSAFYKLLIISDINCDLALIAKQAATMQKQNQASAFLKSKSKDQQCKDIFIDWLSHDANIFDFCNNYLRVMPDCWTFENNTLKCVEVKYENAVPYRRLAKYALMADLIWQTKGHEIEMELKEVCARSGHIKEHCLHSVFNLFEFSQYGDYGWDYLKYENACKKIGGKYKLF